MNQKIILLFIIIIAAFLRLWQLGNTPVSPDWDEVALAYNAQSIIETGRDEYGKFLPIVLRSFDDYKPAMYMYFSIPSIWIFGMNTFAIRLPSALFGIATVGALYFLVKELFQTKEIRVKKHELGRKQLRDMIILKQSQSITVLALLSAFFLAISPWHIQFSRVAFETNVGLACNIFGALCFLWGLRRPWFLSIAVLWFVASLSVYQSERVFTPLLFLLLIILYAKRLIRLPKKWLVLTIAIGVLAFLPLVIYISTDKNALLRAKGVSIFSDPVYTQKAINRIQYDRSVRDKWGAKVDGKYLVLGKVIVDNYLSHFNPNWLFITSDLVRHHAPFSGLLYLWTIPFILIGIYQLIFGKYDKRAKIFIFGWLLLSPVPASITSGVPHAVRVFNAVVCWQVITALGVFWAISKGLQIKYRIFRIKSSYIIIAIVIAIIIFNFLYYLNQYFIQQNYFTSKDWQYGYETAVPYVKSIAGKYKKIIVSSQSPLDQSHMFFLFYLKYPPVLYQKAENISGGFHEMHTFDKYEFRPIDWGNEKGGKGILYIGRTEDFPKDILALKQINYLNGTPAILMVEK